MPRTWPEGNTARVSGVIGRAAGTRRYSRLSRAHAPQESLHQAGNQLAGGVVFTVHRLVDPEPGDPGSLTPSRPYRHSTWRACPSSAVMQHVAMACLRALTQQLTQRCAQLSGFDRFVQQRCAEFLQRASALITAVSRDDDGRDRPGKMFAQMLDHLTADDAVIQVKVRQNQFRCPPLQRLQCADLVGRRHHLTAPLPEQCAHAFKDAQFVVQHQQTSARQC